MYDSFENLIRKLRDETSFVQSEKKHLIELYKQVVKKSEQLFQKQWSLGRQHLILDDLVFGRNNQLSSNQVCTKFSMLDNQIQFTESHKLLGHYDYHISEFFKQLRENPRHVANLIVKGEKSTQMASAQLISGLDNHLFFSNRILIPMLFQSVYGNCVLNQDEVYCLQVLKSLIEIQFSTGGNNQASNTNSQIFFNSNASQQAMAHDFYSNNIDLRKLIRKTSCSFNILFRYYTSFAFSTQLFLHTSLHEPITNVLNDEWYLDIDPEKALGRFTHEEIVNRFGQPNTKEYKLKTLKYREWIVNQLYTSTVLFIENISANLFCFPQSLTWLVNQMYRTITRNMNARSQANQQDMARKLCCDLIMVLYICPAICDPESYGIISDIQITSVARHNLMQIANILQVLAMSGDDKDQKTQDLYSKFKNNCVSDILNSLIWPTTLRSGTDSINDFSVFPAPLGEPLNNTNSIESTSSVASSTSSSSTSLLNRTSLMITLSDIHKILIFARQIISEAMVQIQAPTDGSLDDLKKWLKQIIPGEYLKQKLDSTCASLNAINTQQPVQNNIISPGFPVLTPESTEVLTALMKDPDTVGDYQVLVMSLNDKNYDCPGMLNEEKVLKEFEASQLIINKNKTATRCTKLNHNAKNQHTLKRNQTNEDSDILDSSFEPNSNLAGPASKLINCFDLIDQDAYQEGVEEACCDTLDCGSLSSSDDEETNDRTSKHELNQIMDDIDDANQLEQLRDGLSDFDTFSGRDTPIISGRDTPSSHSHEDLNNSSANKNTALLSRQNRNDSGMLNSQGSSSNVPLRGPHLLPVTMPKANREDINDKFCKFEINKACNTPLREEQMSEAWSLDADPPESVTNEIINDPLDENTSTANLSISSSNQASNATATARGSVHKPTLYSSSTNPSSSNNLINLGNQETNYLINNNNNNNISNNNIIIQPLNPSLPTTTGAINAIATEPVELNLDGDRLSSVSDSAAWSTDLINNSDSDLESNSPSKYTPYSTYSSSSSHQHGAINQAMFFQPSSSLNQNSNNQVLNTQTAPNNAQLNTPNSSAGITTATIKATTNQSSQSVVSSVAAAIANPGIDLIKTAVKSIDSGLNSWNFENLPSLNSSTTAIKGSPTPPIDTPTTQPKQQQKSQSNQVPQAQKRSGFQRLFGMNNKNNSNTSSPSSHLASSSSNASINQQHGAMTSEATGLKPNSSADNIDNILKKYASKSTAATNQPPNISTAPIVNEGILIDPLTGESNVSSPAVFFPKNTSSNDLLESQRPTMFYDSNNVEQSKAFLDAKKKLRIVLSWPDCFSFISLNANKTTKDNFLKMYLKTQLYEAISLQDKEKEAQLCETIRCVSMFTDHDCYKLLRALKKDYNRRVYYLTYLTKSKQNILYSLNLIEKLLQRAKSHQGLYSNHLTSVVAKMFLDTKENEAQINGFVNSFRQLPSVDEKFDSYKSFVEQLKMSLKPVWSNCQEYLMESGNINLERIVIPKVYRYAMFPNGEIDQYRDLKVSECFSELSNVITPSHPLIGIPAIYENECPWTAAQTELRRLNIYKTPQDKLECIKKCMLTIQNLLGIAKSPVCADDLHPVLIYVIIKANPPTFLSNVQFIEGYYGNRLESEDYYWAQFIFAYSYIKANMINKAASSE